MFPLEKPLKDNYERGNLLLKLQGVGLQLYEEWTPSLVHFPVIAKILSYPYLYIFYLGTPISKNHLLEVISEAFV